MHSTTPSPRAPLAVGRVPLAAALLVMVAVLASACGKPSAFGNANSLIVVSASDSLWQEVRDTTYTALEPRIFTVRPEKKFYVQHVDTASTDDFSKLRTFTQVLVFGTADNRFVRRILDDAGTEGDTTPAIVQARDVWAKGQLATAVVLDPERQAGSWRDVLPSLIRRIEGQYLEFVRNRMYVSGVDTAAMDSLGDRFGFGVRFPQVYDVTVLEDGAGPVVIRNDNPSPADLIRSVLVDWRSPPLDTLTPRRAYRWRAGVDSLYYNVPQGIDTVRNRTRRVEVDGRPGVEATGAWRDEGTDFPAGGPFIARLVNCPERTYFFDAWLYAPGRDKYQYMVQLREILDSFSCTPGPGGPAPAPGAVEGEG